MASRTELLQAMKDFQDKAPIQIWPAIVKSVQGTNCTVDIVGTDLTDIDEVNLRADDEATEGILIVPRVGSFVYVSAVENAVDNLFVCLVSEVDRIEVVIDKTKLTIDKDKIEGVVDSTKLTVDKDQVRAVRGTSELTLNDKATLKQGAATVELASGKISVKNAGVSLKDVFSDLTSLLQSFTVMCAAPGSPSAPFPATITQVTALSTKVNLLLS